MSKVYIYYLLLSLNVIENILCFEPITMIGLGTGVAALLGFNYKTVKENTYCMFKECCIDNHVPVNISGLKIDLENILYGQHIVTDVLIPAIKNHYSKKSQSQKPLVIAFHGTPGVGKNFVTDILVKNIYKDGTKSKFVHKYVGRIDFPLQSQVSVYQEELKSKILGAIKLCPKSMFIFDEVDKIPAGTFDSITPLLDHHHNLHGYDFREAVFIFLSNNAGVEIADALIKLNKNGKLREDTKLQDFEKLIELVAYNLEGGLQNAPIIESSLLDHFVPFLPLEKPHIKKCIEQEFKRLNYIPTDEQIEEIAISAVQYNGIFSQSGCKKISKKVEIFTTE